MNGNFNSYQIKFLLIILIPMIILISYLYIDRKEDYEKYIRVTEETMADTLLQEEEFIAERLVSPPLFMFQDSEIIGEHIGEHGNMENLLVKFVVNRLDFGAMGIYSNSRDEIVFHIGKEEIYQDLRLDSIKNTVPQRKAGFYIRHDNNLMYIVPIDGGFVYSFHENIINKPNGPLFVGMILIAIVLAIFVAIWIEDKTKKRIYHLKQELENVKETGGELPIYDDKFSEISKSVNDLKEHLFKQQELLHTILDSLPLAIIYYDQNGDVVYVNNTTTSLTGYSKEEIGQFTKNPSILDDNQSAFWATLYSGQAFLGFESFCPTKFGKEIPVMTSTNIIYDPSSNVLGTISAFMDFSEEERLKKLEYRAKVMLDNISDGVMMVDNNGSIIGFNRGAEKMTGLEAKQVIGKKYDDIFIKRKTIFTKLTQTLETKVEYMNYKKETTIEDGRRIYLMITTKILWDETGNQIGAMGIYKDITQFEELSQQIQRADKLAVVGELAAGTAHEIRNPLTTIKGFIQLLKAEIKDDSKQQYIDLILEEISHINEIIREMLLLAKPSYPKKSLVSINSIINDMVSFMGSEALLHNIEIKIGEKKEIPDIEIDERQVKQVFINIIRNSIQAMDKSGVITISTEYNKSEKRIEVIFADQGKGIPEEQIAKIYEPFFTTKADGTGLGIPVSYQIMKNHGGDLIIKSELYKGTEVKLYFPLDTDDSSEERKE